jgi:2-polyprenyl-3-methyl-5-hydroxy-6-metoxy-1,4-benzoquinol methylase
MFVCKHKSPHFKKIVTMDKSNGYEGIAPFFIKTRGQALNGIGTSSVLNWARTLPMKATVLDLGCGTGIPISKILMDEGMSVYGIDASPTMIKAFQENFPTTSVTCEPIEDSFFFNRTFDAIITWGVFFLLSQTAQAKLIQKIAATLPPGGKIIVYLSPHAG